MGVHRLRALDQVRFADLCRDNRRHQNWGYRTDENTLRATTFVRASIDSRVTLPYLMSNEIRPKAKWLQSLNRKNSEPVYSPTAWAG
jgi:hypothetical protein